MQEFSSKLKSINDIAMEHRWSPKRIRKLIQEGLPVVKIGRQSLISSDTFDRFLREREAPRTRQAP